MELNCRTGWASGMLRHYTDERKVEYKSVSSPFACCWTENLTVSRRAMKL